MPVVKRRSFNYFTGQKYNVILTHWFFLHITRKKHTCLKILTLHKWKNTIIVLFFPVNPNESQKNSFIFQSRGKIVR